MIEYILAGIVIVAGIVLGTMSGGYCSLDGEVWIDLQIERDKKNGRDPAG